MTRNKKPRKGREDNTLKYPRPGYNRNGLREHDKHGRIIIASDRPTLVKSLDTYACNIQDLSTLAHTITVDAQLNTQHIRAPLEICFVFL